MSDIQTRWHSTFNWSIFSTRQQLWAYSSIKRWHAALTSSVHVVCSCVDVALRCCVQEAVTRAAEKKTVNSNWKILLWAEQRLVRRGPDSPRYCLNCTKFGKSIRRKIIQNAATRCLAITAVLVVTDRMNALCIVLSLKRRPDSYKQWWARTWAPAGMGKGALAPPWICCKVF